MARISSILFAICVAACAVAAPMHRRQTGDLDCNLARLKIVFDVAATQKLVSQINATDLETATSVAVAQAGLQSVDSAIQDILAAIFSGQTAPANSRDQVSQGLNAANSALSMIKDPSLNATVTEAQARLLSAGVDGDNVVADCK
ncbi:hypothetical protein B0H13DRAFT_2191855 [Mycena leptocephala]|nr:hypothetical protein B0H13DRAFT_2191855 [Mycena leptocephala]